jgi:hypothetical protein
MSGLEELHIRYMTRVISPDAQKLLNNARSLEDAEKFLVSGQSSFGNWCLPGLLPQQGTCVLYGQSGSGKSFFAVHLALHIAGGLPWLGSKVKKGTVVYLTTEDRTGIEARAVASVRHMDSPQLERLPLVFLTPPPLHSEAWSNAMIDVLSEIQFRNGQPVEAVFLDTLGAAFGGRSQDDAAQMTLATDAIHSITEYFKCMFLSVHHSGKDRYRGMRGSQVLRDRSDTVIAVSASRGGFITAEIQKQRNGPIIAPIKFMLEPTQVSIGDVSIRTCTIVDLSISLNGANKTTADAEQTAIRKPPRDSLTALEVLKNITNGAGVPIEVWRNAVYQAFGDREKDAKRQAFNTARKRLLTDRLVTITGDTVSFLA